MKLKEKFENATLIEVVELVKNTIWPNVSSEEKNEILPIIKKWRKSVEGSLYDVCVLYDHYMEYDLEYLESYKEVSKELKEWSEINDILGLNIFGSNMNLRSALALFLEKTLKQPSDHSCIYGVFNTDTQEFVYKQGDLFINKKLEKLGYIDKNYPDTDFIVLADRILDDVEWDYKRKFSVYVKTKDGTDVL